MNLSYALIPKKKQYLKWIKSTENLFSGVLFIKAKRKLCVTSTEKYSSTMDRYICPTFLQTSPCVK